MLIHRRSSIAMIISCGTLACNSPTKPLEGCIGDIPISLSSSRVSPTPRFDWSPRCGISSLTVSTVPGPGAAPVLVWSFSAPEAAPIGPAVTYGVTPDRATAPRAAQPLVHGVTYRVSIQYIVGGDGIAGSGDEIFSF